MKKQTFIFLLLLFFALLFTACKKYPENTVWFKNIKKIHFFNNSKLTKYTVNGIDSLNLLNMYFGSKKRGETIKSCYFIPALPNESRSQRSVFYVAGGAGMGLPVSYSKDKKYVYIAFGDNYYPFDTTIFRRNLFVDNNTPWQIMKFDTKTGTRKIKKTVNNNTYELQFDSPN